MAAALTTNTTNQVTVNSPPKLVEVKKIVYKTWRLNYIHSNAQKFLLCQINAEHDLSDAIKVAKHFCARSNYRFVFLEDAIITIDDLPTDGD